MRRLMITELKLTALTEDFEEIKPMVRELHQDMLERKAAFSITKLVAKWVVWLTIGAISIFGIAKNPETISWLKDIPR